MAKEMEWCAMAGRMVPKRAPGTYFDETPKQTAARAMLAALQQLADCDLNEGNCADLSIATRRIRNIARPAVAQAKLAGITPAIVAADPTPEGWDIDGLAR